MLKLLVIGAGGFVGAIARYSLSSLAHRMVRGPFPVGTLSVNVLGCLVIGVLMTLVEQRQAFSVNTRLFLMMGLLGSLTTFSTFGYETLTLLRQGGIRMAGWNVALNLILGLSGVMLGHYLTRVVLRG